MRFVLNGREVDVKAHGMKRLLDVLRGECGLTGTKEGCGEGECGACTVLLDGQAVNACLVPFGQVRGHSVTTIEGLRGRHPLQRAFVTEGGTQCGVCTPGMIMAAAALPKGATREDVRVGLAGNICRCTGYEGIYRAVKKASASARSNSVRATARPRRSAEREGGHRARPTAHGSRLTAQGSRLTAQGSRPTAQGPSHRSTRPKSGLAARRQPPAASRKGSR